MKLFHCGLFMQAHVFAIIFGVLLLSATHPLLAEEDLPDRNTSVSSVKPVLAAKHSNSRFESDKSEDPAIRWFYGKAAKNFNAVALVIHGLNCRPDKMESIIAELTESEIDCLNLSLRGHGENYSHRDSAESKDARMEAFKSVSYSLWKTEIQQGYKQAKKRSKQYNLPLVFIGFSMGALLGIDLFASNPNVYFDKMVLFAPALKMHPINYLLNLFSPFPRLVIPSLAPEAYLANEGTPMAAYNAFFDALKYFENNLNSEINIPTLIFIDKRDELISLTRLQKMVAEKKLDQWKFHIVQKGKTKDQVKMHHIVIDEASTGKKMWNEIVETTINHLLN